MFPFLIWIFINFRRNPSISENYTFANMSKKDNISKSRTRKKIENRAYQKIQMQIKKRQKIKYINQGDFERQ